MIKGCAGSADVRGVASHDLNGRTRRRRSVASFEAVGNTGKF